MEAAFQIGKLTELVGEDGKVRPHRTRAAILNGAETIGADVRDGGLRDAIEYALGANATHGQRRARKDVRRAIEIVLRDDEWGRRANIWICRMVGGGVSKNTIEARRVQMETTCQIDKLTELLGEDGNMRPRRYAKRSTAQTPNAPATTQTPTEPEGKPTDGEQLGLTGSGASNDATCWPSAWPSC